MSVTVPTQPGAESVREETRPAVVEKPPVTERERHERNLGFMLAGPAFGLMMIVTAYPVLNSIWLSFNRYTLSAPDDREFVGLTNYLTVLSSPVWWNAFVTTVFITVATVAAELVIGFAFAMIMHRAIFGRRTVRTAILIPYGIVTVVSAFAWQFAFDPTAGFVNDLFGVESNFFGGRWSALFVVFLAELWKTTPFISLLLLAGLATVPHVLQEAAEVDGARAWQRLWKVTIPNMKAAILVAVLFRTLDAFRIFDTIFVMTRGANNTESLSVTSYNQMISRLNIGLGSAVSVLLFICVVLIAVVFVKGFKTNIGAARGDR
jgi:multiple sugar transport system permease protein